MKNIIVLCVLFSAVLLGQSCAPSGEKKSDAAGADSKDAPATLVAVKTSDEIAATRARIAKATAEREAERNLAIAEKAKMTPTYKDAAGKIVYYKAEVPPSYIGGIDALREYLKENLTYPQTARDMGLEGTVFVDFTVDEKGRIRDVVASDVVGEDVDFLFKEESVRVVAAMPGWQPGRQHGKPVDTWFSIPISFQLDN